METTEQRVQLRAFEKKKNQLYFTLDLRNRKTSKFRHLTLEQIARTSGLEALGLNYLSQS